MLADANIHFFLHRNAVSYMHDVYFPPWCRVGSFAIGLMLGYLMVVTRRQLMMSKVSISVCHQLS